MKFLRAVYLILALVVFGFLLGSYLALLNLEQPSGLAGPGIVVGTGLFGVVAALITAAIILSRFSARRVVIIATIALVLSLVVFFLIWRAKELRLEKRKTTPIGMVAYQSQTENIGLGMARPNFFENSTLYFYQPNLQKAVGEHVPIDSLVFKQTELGYVLSYAPPWFYPDHLKMDYEILWLKFTSITQDWVELTVNQQTGKTAWMSIQDVNLTYWPEFILSLPSIRLASDSPLKVKPMDHAGEAYLQAEYYRPTVVKGDWLKLEAIDVNGKSLGSAWVKWRSGNRLLVEYDLLS